MVVSYSDQDLDRLLASRARLVVTLGERLPNPADSTSVSTDDPLDELIFVLLKYRSAHGNPHVAYSSLRQRFPDWSELASAPREEIEEGIQTTGLARQRADLIQKLMRRVLSDFPNGSLVRLHRWDDAAVLAYLASLPGVGRLAALQVMLNALNRPVFPVSWPLVRLLTRLGIVDRNVQAEAVLKAAAGLVPSGQHRYLYDKLLAHAQRVCAARVPRCRQCRLHDRCSYYKRTRVHSGHDGRAAAVI